MSSHCKEKLWPGPRAPGKLRVGDGGRQVGRRLEGAGEAAATLAFAEVSRGVECRLSVLELKVGPLVSLVAPVNP